MKCTNQRIAELFGELEAAKKIANDLAQDAARWEFIRDCPNEKLTDVMSDLKLAGIGRDKAIDIHRKISLLK